MKHHTIALAIGISLFTASAFADEKTIYLQNQMGEKTAIATIHFDQKSYKIKPIEKPFGDYFLSMRPFRCIETTDIYCRQPYPYPLDRTISDDQLKSLEHDLMFIAKKQNEYGIDPYNGRYYVLEKTNNGFKGDVYGVDLNIIASPPEEGDMHPLKREDMEKLEFESAQYPTLIIE